MACTGPPLYPACFVTTNPIHRRPPHPQPSHPMKYYYANASNQPSGPVTLDELRQLLARGEITSATNIIPVGETTWRPLSTVIDASGAPPIPGTTSASPATPPASPLSAATSAAGSAPAAGTRPAFKAADAVKLPTILSSFIGVILAGARKILSPALLNRVFGFCNPFGQLLILLGAVLALIAGIVYAIRYDSFQFFMTGLIAVVVLAILQFVAKRLLDACASILQTSPTRVASVAILECIGLILLLASVAILVGGIVSSIRLETGAPLVPALISFVLLAASAAVALHPSLVNVEQAPASAGEEAIGLLSFFAKAMLVLQPLVFFLYAAGGAIVLLFAIFGVNLDFAATLLAAVPFPVPTESIGVALLAAACIFPLFAYIGFLFYHLLIDVIRAILVIPSKLDQLRR